MLLTFFGVGGFGVRGVLVCRFGVSSGSRLGFSRSLVFHGLRWAGAVKGAFGVPSYLGDFTLDIPVPAHVRLVTRERGAPGTGPVTLLVSLVCRLALGPDRFVLGSCCFADLRCLRT